ncbi:hypothetical protein HHK36_030196 [Tetracentron sinense]|uniref:Protein kinase domain-containing protein n=1 Tax=Tetracentron sinense TaxID=13715 RepID=A0A835D028_TETSI|nr:hypothetical protein HHK36_030196 [Tetracentron sinense]
MTNSDAQLILDGSTSAVKLRSLMKLLTGSEAGRRALKEADVPGIRKHMILLFEYKEHQNFKHFSWCCKHLFLASACRLHFIMADSVDVILDFLRKNQFTRAEAALRGELSNRPELNGSLQKPISEEKDSGYLLEKVNESKPELKHQGTGSPSSGEISKELIVKEIECGTGRNDSENRWGPAASVGKRNKPTESTGTSETPFAFTQGSSQETSSDLYSWKFNPSNGPIDQFQKDAGIITNNFSELHISERYHSDQVSDKGNSVIGAVKSVESYGTEIALPGEHRASWLGCTSKANDESKYETNQTSDCRELDQQRNNTSTYSKDRLVDNPWSRSEVPTQLSLDLWKESSLNTVIPFPKGDPSTSYHSVLGSSDNKKEGKRKVETNDIRAAMKEQVDEVGRSLFFGKSQGSSGQKTIGSLDFPHATMNDKEELPRLPPVKLKSEDKPGNIHWEEKFDGHGLGAKVNSTDNSFLIGSFLDVPIGQEINSSGPFCPSLHQKPQNCGVQASCPPLVWLIPLLSFAPKAPIFSTKFSLKEVWIVQFFSNLSRLGSNPGNDDPGGKRTVGNSWLSVSQGIAGDTSDMVSGFATVGDGLSESLDYPNEYWDSDEYNDDDDVGYMRQPIEDETWFLAHEIDYPSDNEKGTGHGSVPDLQEKGPTKDEDDDQSFAEEDSYFSGEQYFQAKNTERVAPSNDPMGLSMAEMYGRADENDLIAQYDGQLMDEEELNLMRAEPVWQGFVTQTSELMMLGNERVLNESERSRLDDLCMDDEQHDSVRSIGVGINSDAADIGSELRESLVGGSSEGDLEYFHDNNIGIGGSRHIKHDTDTRHLDRPNRGKRRITKQDSEKYHMGNEKGVSSQVGNYTDGGFSFPPPLRDGNSMQTDSGKQLWSSKCNALVNDERGDCAIGLVETDDMLATWKQKSSDSSPVKSSRDENNTKAISSENSSASTLSNYGYAERELIKKGEDDEASDAREDDPGTTLEDEEAAAVQEQVRQIKAQEEEFETFSLKIVHRKNRHVLLPVLVSLELLTGFEEDKNFHVVLNSVIAGRYHVTEYLGSAAFSKAIQAHDLHTGMDVCVKIIKNNKDFFDQSLDEIKLLKFVNKNDPADKYHILRLYDYFYYREHLLIVCELLKANLYEFHKFNRESGGEVYFTMPRLQSITVQCLESLQFLHGLGLIHCDLKPENILVKSYSRCEVKVIDLGSSCFETDHLCSYVQSRSYRAPEVILGLPYDKKIDIWSLGCILAELCTGNVLFQNDSPATLLARVIGIIGPIDQGMLAKGRDTYKYFTKNHMLYERNQNHLLLNLKDHSCLPVPPFKLLHVPYVEGFEPLTHAAQSSVVSPSSLLVGPDSSLLHGLFLVLP